jgi:cold-inducible RNA-binding protein
MKRLFVGSLAWKVTDQELKELFETIGPVVTATVMMDRDTGKSRGFAFVEMQSQEDADKAVDVLNGHDMDGRSIAVSIAKPKPDSGSRYDRPRR